MEFDFRRTLDGYKPSFEGREAVRLLECVLEQLRKNGIWGNKTYKKGDAVMFLFTLGRMNKKLSIHISYSINQSEWKDFFIDEFTYDNDMETEKVFSSVKEILEGDGYNIVNVTIKDQNDPRAFAIAI